MKTDADGKKKDPEVHEKPPITTRLAISLPLTLEIINMQKELKKGMAMNIIVGQTSKNSLEIAFSRNFQPHRCSSGLI